MQPLGETRITFDPAIFSDWDIAGQTKALLETTPDYKSIEDDFIANLTSSVKGLSSKSETSIKPYYVIDKKPPKYPLKLFYFPVEALILAPLKSKLGHRRATGAHKRGCLALLYHLKEKRIEKVWQLVRKQAVLPKSSPGVNKEAFLTQKYGYQPYWPKNHLSKHRVLYIKTVKDHDVTLQVTKECTVFDYYPYDLKTVSKMSPPLPPLLILKIALDVLEGLEFLHKENLVHSDVKLGNILVGKERALLTDYDHTRDASKKPAGKRYFYTTKRYTSPERLEYFPPNNYHNKAADIYALGISLADCSGIPAAWSQLFHVVEEKKTILLAQKALLPASESSLATIDAPCEDPTTFIQKLVYALLHPEPKKRITATQAVASIKKKEYPLPENLLVAIKEHREATVLRKTS